MVLSLSGRFYCWVQLSSFIGPMSPGEPLLQHPTSHPPPLSYICIPICTFWIWTLLLEESYKRRHHSRGMAQSLDSSIGTLLKVVVIPRHVEWGECRATPLHGAGNGWWGQRHPKSAVWWQRALYGWGMGVAMDAVLVPRAVRDCGCWNAGKLDEDDTQELRDKLSDVVKADPERKKKNLIRQKLYFNMQIKNYIICKHQFKKIYR